MSNIISFGAPASTQEPGGSHLLHRLNTLLRAAYLPPLRNILDVTPYLLIVLYEAFPTYDSRTRRYVCREKVPFVDRLAPNETLYAKLKNLKLLIGTIGDEKLEPEFRRRMLEIDIFRFCQRDPATVDAMVELVIELLEEGARPPRPDAPKRSGGFKELSKTPILGSGSEGYLTDTNSATSSLVEEVARSVNSILMMHGVASAFAPPVTGSAFPDPIYDSTSETSFHTPRAQRLASGIIRSRGYSPSIRFETSREDISIHSDMTDSRDLPWLEEDEYPTPPSESDVASDSTNPTEDTFRYRRLPRSSVLHIFPSRSRSHAHRPSADFDSLPPPPFNILDDISPVPSRPESPQPSFPETQSPQRIPPSDFLLASPDPAIISYPPSFPSSEQSSHYSSARTSQISVSSPAWSSDSTFTALLRQRRQETLQKLQEIDMNFGEQVAKRESELLERMGIADELEGELERAEEEGTVRLERIEEIVRALVVRKGWRIEERRD